ncbi:MAG: RluA family pseudouridine synthase [Lachnospiraceae bacterium]|nr:RluA family pseudouridine synthase [Lachnospiraceae bacterium]
MRQFIVQQNEAGQRFDKLLLKILNKAPKSFIYKMLRKKNIVLNGKKADGSERLAVNDEIKLFLSDATIEQFQEAVDPVKTDYHLDIIYEDSHLLMINKPYGVLSQKAEKDDISLVEYIISYLLSSKQLTKEQLVSFRPGICNRLDRNTSGLILAGKSLLGLQEMARLLKYRDVDKYYLCIVKGKVKERQRIEGYLEKDTGKNTVIIQQEQPGNSDYICTEYEPLAYSSVNNSRGVKGSYTLLQVKLITGRSHQIRAHLASIGYPIVGDFKYGEQKTNLFFKSTYGLSHQLLHSYRMVFPVIEGELSYLSGKEFKAEPPEIFDKMKEDLFTAR